jgi:hypothetical protein
MTNCKVCTDTKRAKDNHLFPHTLQISDSRLSSKKVMATMIALRLVHILEKTRCKTALGNNYLPGRAPFFLLAASAKELDMHDAAQLYLSRSHSSPIILER